MQGTEWYFFPPLTKSQSCVFSNLIFCVVEILSPSLWDNIMIQCTCCFCFRSHIAHSNIDQQLTEVGKLSAADGGGPNSANVVLGNAICSCRSVGEDMHFQSKYAFKKMNTTASQKRSKANLKTQLQISPPV